MTSPLVTKGCMSTLISSHRFLENGFLLHSYSPATGCPECWRPTIKCSDKRAYSSTLDDEPHNKMVWSERRSFLRSPPQYASVCKMRQQAIPCETQGLHSDKWAKELQPQ